MRQPADTRFATTPNSPAAGLSLYRFSYGHAGLACEACHGWTHAEYVSSHANDNVQSIGMQGHAGAITECSACHSSITNTTNGGPHNMHVVGQRWVQLHQRAAGGTGRTACADCHGSDYRGTVLSRASMDRTLTVENGTRQLFRGSIVGCYMPQRALRKRHRTGSTNCRQRQRIHGGGRVRLNPPQRQRNDAHHLAAVRRNGGTQRKHRDVFSVSRI